MALALALRLVPALSLALALRLTGPGSSPSSIALALALLLARLDMLLWNQVALWRHAAGARTITGYPFGPTNLPVNAFGPWPGGTSWTPPAETACVLPWLGRHSVVPSRGRGVGPPLHEATHLLQALSTSFYFQCRSSSNEDVSLCQTCERMIVRTSYLTPYGEAITYMTKLSR